MTDAPRIIVAEAHAFYQNDRTDGFGRGLRFANDTEGLEYCQELERWYTLRGHLYQPERMLRTAKLLAARAERTDEEQKSIISSIYWLMRRGAIPCDEFNGTFFHVIVVRDGATDLLLSEENPATLDLNNLGPSAVDVTDIARASPFLPGDKGALAALRVATEHARKKR